MFLTACRALRLLTAILYLEVVYVPVRNPFKSLSSAKTNRRTPECEIDELMVD